MASTVRRFDTVRRAAVRICDRKGEHHGNGLLLDLDEEGTVVLTCHHVVARLAPEELSIALRRDDGSITEPQPARYDAVRSRPAMDAVVLRMEGVRAPERPLLHALNTAVYAGTLPVRATGFSWWKTDTFDARVSTSTRLEIPVDRPGVWPDPPARYVLPGVLRLADPSDARPGISGSPVAYEDGVLGLAHFSRGAGADFEREVYLVPLAVWAQDWPALGRLIEPLIDARLRAVATVKRAASLEVASDVVIARFRSDVYVEPPALAPARTALAARKGVMIVGRPKSGKTRLAWQLFQENPDALVIIPRRGLPPESFEGSSFSGRAVILFFDDLHRGALTSDPMEWRARFDEISGGRCALICTCRDGADLRAAEGTSRMAELFSSLGRESFVFTSKSEGGGRDLTEAEGLHLADTMAMNREEFSRRFDGTVGSLTLDLSDMRQRYQRLREEFRGEVSMSRLLDSAKLLYEGSQPRLTMAAVRAVAERIRGDGTLSAEIRDALERRTRDEGFGRVDSASQQFQIYRPYLEECVDYAPSLSELEQLVDILTGLSDYEGLEHLAQALFMRFRANGSAEKAARAAIAGGRENAAVLLGWILGDQPERAAEMDEFYRKGIAAGRDSWINYGNWLGKDASRHADAEEAYREAIRSAGGSETAVAHWSLANLLWRQAGREDEVEASYRYAADHGLFMGSLSLAKFLATRNGREREAEDACGAAIDLIEFQISASGKGGPEFGKNPARRPNEYLREALSEAWFYKGAIVQRDPNRTGEAEPAYRRAIELGSTNAAVNLGILLASRAGGAAQAEELFRKGMAAGIDIACFNLARLLKDQPGRLGEAESVLREAVRAGYDGARRKLGALLAEQPGSQADAEQEFRAAIASGDSLAWQHLGALLASIEGRADEAEAAYRAAIDAGLPHVSIALGNLLAEQPDRRADAIKAYRQAASDGDADALYNLGMLLQDTESDLPAAEEAFREAAAAGVSSALEPLGRVYMRQDRYEEAEAAFRAAVDSGAGEAQVGLGTVLLLTDRVEEGKELLEQAKEAGHSAAAAMLEVLARGDPEGDAS